MNALRLIHALLLPAFVAVGAAAATKPSRYADLILADKPAAYWRLNDTGTTALNSAPGANAVALNGVIEGKVAVGQRAQPSDQFPEFEPDSAAAGFNGKGEFIRVKDPGAKSVVKFAKGDAITMEAWVSASAIKEGQQVYVIGKGRTGNKGFPSDNQNYALRLRGEGGAACVSFLFRDAEGSGAKNSKSDSEQHWHRWTANDGFLPGSGWHHVAVTYTFGKGSSVKGYLDGVEVKGKWDMGGQSHAAPVVDDDEVWIGSSMGAQAGSTFNGLINEVAIHRRALDSKAMALRFNFVPPVVKFDLTKLPKDAVQVELFEGIGTTANWNFTVGTPVETYTEPAFGFVGLPQKYTERGVRADRSNPFLLRASALVKLPAGEHKILLRSLQGAKLHVDGKLAAQTKFIAPGGSGHSKVPPAPAEDYPANLRFPLMGHQETWFTVKSTGKEQLVVLEAIIGGKGLRPEVGELTVSAELPAQLASTGKGAAGKSFHLLSPVARIPHDDLAWESYSAQQLSRLATTDAQRRRDANAAENQYWSQRHEAVRKFLAGRPAPASPPASSAGANAIDRFISAKLAAAKVQPAPLTDDTTFLRRLAFDTIGVPPTAEQLRAFLADNSPNKRAAAIDRFLALPGWADNWVGYWQDVLAENPGILKPTLNNTGPFRWWIHESFADNKPMDRFATELIAMDGSVYHGGPAGFGLATQNDVPMADRAQIVSQAFLAMNLACARCHDAPYHDFKQRDLFSLAALLKRDAQDVPKSSSIPDNANIVVGKRIQVTLHPGEKVTPAWTFASYGAAASADFTRKPDDTREQLAAYITSPASDRFAQVIVNRAWKRWLGLGFIEPVDDWENKTASHPELLAWLAREFMVNGYDLKHLARLVFNSQAYQRVAGLHVPKSDEPMDRLFASPARRRLAAEQLVDSLFAVTGKPMTSELLTLDNDAKSAAKDFLNLGYARRAWQFTGLSNDRDRPALSMPKTQAIIDVLQMFGWRETRQGPLSTRDHSPNVLQPAVLANGDIGNGRIARLTDDCAVTDLCVENQPLPALVDAVFARMLSRPPTAVERAKFVSYLEAGFKERVVDCGPRKSRKDFDHAQLLSWTNHLNAKASEIKYVVEEKARLGDEPTQRLKQDWRERMEDVLWAMVNSPEFVFVP
ncbi:MAG: DUF1553 domain-containing protein [Proteobacteria bacterium]|nr:DUF1553 domain-containing protein [Verrucomicrobiota bacterium]NBU10269.1 DUF1553 domain-containing protein [Pseudomonadota bacterium]